MAQKLLLLTTFILIILLASGLSNAECGPAAKTYEEEDTGFEGKLCEQGKARGISRNYDPPEDEYELIRQKCHIKPVDMEGFLPSGGKPIGEDMLNSDKLCFENSPTNGKKVCYLPFTIGCFEAGGYPVVTGFKDKMKFFIPPGVVRVGFNPQHPKNYGYKFVMKLDSPPDMTLEEFNILKKKYRTEGDHDTFDNQEKLKRVTSDKGRITSSGGDMAMTNFIDFSFMNLHSGREYYPTHKPHWVYIDKLQEIDAGKNPRFHILQIQFWVDPEIYNQWVGQTKGDMSESFYLDLSDYKPRFPLRGDITEWECVSEDDSEEVLSVCSAKRKNIDGSYGTKVYPVDSLSYPGDINPLFFLVGDKQILTN